MPTTLEDQITNGSRFSARALLTASEKIADSVSENQARFTGLLPPAWSKQLAAKSSLVEKLLSAKDATSLDVVPTGESLDAALAPAKDWKSTLLGYVDNAFETNPRAASTFHRAAGPSAATPAKVVDSLKSLVPLAKAHAKDLQTQGADKSFAARGQKALDALTSAITGHKAALKKLPPAARKLQAAKGDLYTWLKKASRVARKKHIGAPGAFAVSEIARTHRRATVGNGAPTTPPADPSNPGAPATTQSLTSKKTTKKRRR